MNVTAVANVIAQSAPTSPPPPSAMANGLVFAIAMGLVAFMLLSARSQRKREQRERDNLYARIAKNDRVLTIGGIIGTVASVKDNEVILKVDESTNTKMTFLKSSVQKILSNEVDASEKK